MRDDRQSLRPALACIVAFGASLASAPGYGYTWDYSSVIGTGLSYQTNPDYVSDSSLEEDAYAAFVDGSLLMSAETERSRINFRPRAHASVYAGTDHNSDLNGIDYYVPFDGFWAAPRAEYDINTGYSRISQRTSEAFVTDPNDPGQTGSSGRIVSVDSFQERAYFHPSVQLQVGPRDLLNLTLSVDDVRYTDAELTGRSDYVYGSSSASWIHSLGLKSRISGTINVNGFSADVPGSTVENETISYGADAGYEYSLSDVMSVGLTAGTSQSDVSVTGLAAIDSDDNPNTPPLPCFDPQQNTLVLCELNSNERNFVGRAFIRQQAAETITSEFSVSRSLQPNSDGAQVTQDAINAYTKKNFTPNLTGTLGATYIRQQAVGKDVAGGLAQRFDSEYTRVDASLVWNLSPTWSLNANYSFSHNEQKSGATYTTNNQILSVEVRYAGLGKH